MISIIIPTFNRAHLIGETLDSIIAQTYQNWECIVVDDCSTDNTEEVLEEYLKKDTRIFFYKKPNDMPKGPSAARNFGFQKSKGEYINFFDSDDLMHPQKLEIDLKNIQSGDFDFTISQSEFFGGIIDKKYWNAKLWSSDPINDFIVKGIGWSTNAPLWKNNKLKKMNLIFDEELVTADDYFFHIEALAHGFKPHINTDVLVNQRVHPNRLNNHSVKSPFKLKVNFYLIKNINSLGLNPNTIFVLNQQFKNQFSNLLKNKKLKIANSYLLKGLGSSLKPSTKIYILKIWVFGVFYYYIGYGYKFLN